MSRRCCSSPVPAALDDEDLLIEILLRIPPMPSSLPRASLVCKHWRRIIADPRFLRRFRNHHAKLPLLGFFGKAYSKYPVFTPLLDPPDRIPAARFVLPPNLRIRFTLGSVFLGCRDGVALFLDRPRREVILWDPLFSHQRRVAFPAGCQYGHAQSAGVLRAAGGNGGDCSLSPFKLVLVWHGPRFRKAFACLYESESGVWGDIISAATTDVIYNDRPSVLVGNALFWLLVGGGILEFDFERLALVVIEKPADPHVTDFDTEWPFQILRGGDNSLGLAMLSDSKKKIRLWARKSNSDGVAAWVLQNTVRLDELLSWSLRPGMGKLVLMLGYDEDTNQIFLSSKSDDFMLQLDSMKISYIGTREYNGFRKYYPYTNFFAAVRSPAGRDGGAEM